MKKTCEGSLQTTLTDLSRDSFLSHGERQTKQQEDKYKMILRGFVMKAGVCCCKGTEMVAQCDVTVQCNGQSTTTHGSAQFIPYSNHPNLIKVKVKRGLDHSNNWLRVDPGQMTVLHPYKVLIKSTGK